MSKFIPLDLEDLKNPAKLADSLWKVGDPLSEYIRKRLSDETKRLLEEYGGAGCPSEALCRALVAELNRLVEDPNLIQEVQQFSQITWTEETRRQFEQGTQGDEVFELNRKVLEGAYPQALLEDSSRKRVHVDKGIYMPSFQLGPRASFSMINDPKHLLFRLARYKFCAKMLQRKSSVLEIGCGDAFGSPLVAQVVDCLLCVDIEPYLIEGNRERFKDYQDRFNAFQNIEFRTMDMISKMPDRTFDAAFAIDLWEHLQPEEEEILGNICRCLSQDGMLIIGTPNIESDKYSSESSPSPHINLKSHITLRQMLDRHFANSLIFSMNDEVVHTGFYPMAHYLFGIGVGKKNA